MCGMSAKRKRGEDEARSIVVDEEFLQCPITHEVMSDPVVAADGHTYERWPLRTWLLRGNGNSPCTGLPLAHSDVVPNMMVRGLVSRLRDAHPALLESPSAKTIDADLFSSLCDKAVSVCRQTTRWEVVMNGDSVEDVFGVVVPHMRRHANDAALFGKGIDMLRRVSGSGVPDVATAAARTGVPEMVAAVLEANTPKDISRSALNVIGNMCEALDDHLHIPILKVAVRTALVHADKNVRYAAFLATRAAVLSGTGTLQLEEDTFRDELFEFLVDLDHRLSNLQGDVLCHILQRLTPRHLEEMLFRLRKRLIGRKDHVNPMQVMRALEAAGMAFSRRALSTQEISVIVSASHSRDTRMKTVAMGLLRTSGLLEANDPAPDDFVWTSND